MSTTGALDPLTRLPAPTHSEPINNGVRVRVLAPLIGVDANSPEGDQLRQRLIDTHGAAPTATLSGRPYMDARQSPRSAALAIMPTSRRYTAEPGLATQRDDEWRAALAASEMPD